MARITFLLGGARSGKSSYAIELARRSGDRVLYLATGVCCDEEMRARIEVHKKTRPESWKVVEKPLNIESVLENLNEAVEVVILDCLTFWVSNLLLHYQGKGITGINLETEVMTHVSRVISIAQNIKPHPVRKSLPILSPRLGGAPTNGAQVIIVSNEVGMGIVPETPLGRVFRDILGKANRLVAASADEVFLLVAGLPMKIK